MKKNNYPSLYFFFFLFFVHTSIISQQLHSLKTHELIHRQLINIEHANLMSSLQVQDFQGRMKPIHTLSLELLRKIYGKNSYRYYDKNNQKQTLTPTQVFLGMQYKPDSWQLINCIKIEKKAIPDLKGLLKITHDGYSSPSQFFDFKGNYRLKEIVNKAYETAPGKRNAFDKDIIKIDERINIVWAIFNGQFLRIFPKKGDPDKKWYAPMNPEIELPNEDSKFYEKIIPTYFAQLTEGQETKNWNKANETVQLLKNFQEKNGADVLLSKEKVRWEIWFNTNNVFFLCMIGYTLLGITLLVLSFLHLIIHRKNKLSQGIRLLIMLITMVFFYHAFGIIIRWYISGHAPWSNGYEATVFIAWVGMLAGLIFAKKSSFTPAVSCILAFCLLGIAHGSLMSPEITNLVPVLKSYWLLIHVAIITGSYGFLALGSLLSLIVLLMMTINKIMKSDRIDETIREITNINQLTSTIGLYMLTIGTFLGGIWANESWGRYWGWDPKETWALISIIIYSFVLHIRIIIPKNFLYIYNVCSFFAIGSLIMTFFGVNYYLSGLHSYAKGDSFPIPSWLYIVVPLAILLSILPKLNFPRKNHRIKKPATLDA
ncbi:cytochrome c biogenesis protein [Aquimarina pacifica]|uniref:cytochrome c biogenesis protein n=1 Tax=Aquimarina pacifica TaxID=1296415 RepID=UPI000471C587|nr:cytochrome c biogenesis protein CcsA [Aquimarina pacifica]